MTDQIICELVLKTRQVFRSYLYETYVVPQIREIGPNFRFDDLYKIYMRLINDKEFFMKMKAKYDVLPVSSSAYFM